LKTIKKIFGIGIACLFLVQAYSQTNTAYKVETFGAFATGKHTPFWMVNRNWGMTPLHAGNCYLRGGVSHEQKFNSDWLWGVGIDLAGGSGSSCGKIWIQQIYGQLDWKGLRLELGSRETYTSLLDEYLSSGDMLASNNARPVPEIKVRLKEFVLVPYTKGNMYFKGDFSVGKPMDSKWQESIALPHTQEYTKNVLSHRKAVYFRFGNIEEKHKLQLTLGLNHYVQWGGIVHRRDYAGGDGYEAPFHQPNDLLAFFKIVIPQRGGANYSLNDSENYAGGHSGTILAKFDYKVNDANQLSVYLMDFFKTGGNLRALRDMLYGIQYKSSEKKLLSGVLFEYLYTKHQGGPIHFVLQDDAHAYLRNTETGNNDYYNNGDYTTLFSHYGQTLGTPLFLSPAYTCDDGRLVFKNNRIIAFHLGLEGYIHSDLQYRFLFSTGKGWGRYRRPFLSAQTGFASEVELIYTCPKVEGLNVKFAAGYDQGDFFGGNTFGAGITLSKQGVISFPKTKKQSKIL